MWKHELNIIKLNIPAFIHLNVVFIGEFNFVPNAILYLESEFMLCSS